MLSTYSGYPRESAGEEDDTTVVQEGAFNTVGIQVHGNQARLLFGRSPFEPRVTVPLSRVSVSGDIGDLVGFLNTQAAYISTLNSDSATITTLQNQSIDTESITTLGQPLYVDWFADATDLPSIQLVNNPLKYKQNSDKSKSGFQIEDVFIGAAEGLAGDALLFLGKAAGGWLLNAGQAAISMFNGYAALGEAGLSIGADAAGLAGAAGGDAALFAAGSEGLVMASSASEAASLFGSLGVLAEGGSGFASELGEVGQGLLTGIENSSGSFVAEAMPNFYDTLLGSARWVTL